MGGNLSFGLLGARMPMVGGSATGYPSAGACHELKAFPHCTLAKGFENSKPGPASPPLLSFFGKDGSDTLPKPALWRAILVPSLLSIVVMYDVTCGRKVRKSEQRERRDGEGPELRLTC